MDKTQMPFSEYMKYVKLGVNHHMLNKRTADDPEMHCKTMLPLLEDPHFEVVDLYITDAEPFRREETKAILDSNKEIVYNIGERPGKKMPNPSSLIGIEQKYAWDFFRNEIDMGLECNSKKIVIFSGKDNVNGREDARKQFFDFSCRLCEYVPEDVVFVLEPADREVDKKMLIGPTGEAVAFVKEINKAGYNNFKMMIDMCHVPLLGESLESAMEESRGLLGHIHLGNSIKCNPGHPFYGDAHPPLGLEDSVYSAEDIALVIGKAVDIGYIANGRPDTVTFEMVGYENMTWQESINKFLEIWKLVWKFARERQCIKNS